MLTVVLLAGVASAKDLFVSTSGTWTMPGMTGNKYTSLQTAATAARTGDTVWVQDGFVWATGSTGTYTTSPGKTRLVLPAYAFTLRSESGYVDETAGKGACIRGVATLGNNGIRPVRMQNAGTVLMGFVLEDGATSKRGTTGSCGAVYGTGIISNCVVRNCSAYQQDGAFGTDGIVAYNTVITNCHVENTSTLNGGGAVYGNASLYNCLVADNSSALVNGGAIQYANAAGGVAPVYSNCVFRGNSAPGAGCADFTGDGVRATFIDCVIEGNEAKNGNVGGVRGNATFMRCKIIGNRATGDVGAVGAASATAGASPELMNCVVSNNVAGGKYAALYLPGGGKNYNCLVVGNTSGSDSVVEGNVSSSLSPKFYNCTIADNMTTEDGPCVRGISFFNSIVWGNATTNEMASCLAEYSCQKDLNPRLYNNVTNNPALSPVDYRPTTRNACVDSAKYETWMDSEYEDGTVRTMDALGYPRIRGPKPDRGSCERAASGAIVIGR